MNKPNIPTIEIAPGVFVPKIGIGTWGIGGYMKKNPYNDDDNDIKQIRYQLDQGLLMIDTWLAQSEGYQIKIISQAIKDYPRHKYFIVAKLDVKNFIDKKDLESTVDQYLKLLGIGYIDLLQIHSPQYNGLSLQNVTEEMCRMVDVGKAKLLGVCNANVAQVKEIVEASKYPITSNEINYSIIDRTYDENGTVDYCQKNNIKILAYKALARGATNYLSGVAGPPIFKELSAKYDKTSNQIALNWLLSKPNFMAWVKSVNPSHINENLDSLSFVMDPEDHQKLNDWKYNK
jgi:diketogulonate reductase-like aldo/keto reductase